MISPLGRHPGALAALLHRISGLALAVFLPVHFLALGTTLAGADALDRFLEITRTPLVKAAEIGLVVAAALHLGLGLRVLRIEFIPGREQRPGAAVVVSVAAALGVGCIVFVAILAP